jgi:Phosphotransferase enzyme family
MNNAAVHAWSELGVTPLKATRVEILKNRNASHVYRLAGAGPDGSHVIAKRCLRANALAERTIYEQVLRHLPGRSLRYYGLVQEREGEFCWVFVEDAAGVPYSPTTPEHGHLAAEWLAAMHVLTPAVVGALRLPERGPTRYLRCLRSGRERIHRNLGNPVLGEDDRAILAGIVEQCGAAEALWPRIQACCDTVSPTFVHADLHAKNIHVSRDRTALLPFDWESAGWGPPAVDIGLSGLDLHAYRLAVRGVWPELESGLLEKLAVVGRLFQLFAHIEWESKGLSSAWLHRPMKHMRYYLAELAQALDAARTL